MHEISATGHYKTNQQSINQSINQISEVKFLGNFCLLLHRSTLGDLSN
jgi:hypothetical protein